MCELALCKFKNGGRVSVKICQECSLLHWLPPFAPNDYITVIYNIKTRHVSLKQMCRPTRQGNPNADDDAAADAATANESNPYISPFQVTQ